MLLVLPTVQPDLRSLRAGLNKLSNISDSPAQAVICKGDYVKNPDVPAPHFPLADALCTASSSRAGATNHE